MSNIQSNIAGGTPSGQQSANNPPNILDIISLLSSTQNPSTNKPYTLSEQTPQQANLPSQNNLNALSNQQSSLNQPDFNNLLETLQTVQLFSSLSNPPIVAPKETTTSKIPKVSESSALFLKNFNKFDDSFKSAIDFRRNATNIVYVEGLPNDATEREVAHLFRPFVGFKSVRLITREKNGQNSLICFADFENVLQSTICINTLQGYRFDKNDLIGLHFSYGVSKHKDHRDSKERNRRSRERRK